MSGSDTIRPFQEKDRQRVVELWQSCNLTVPWNDPNKDIDRKLQSDALGFLVLEQDGQVLATAMAGYDGHRGWINYLAVDPVYQGRALGRKIMKTCEDLLKKRGCPKINLQLRTNNEEAFGFYQALGFTQDQVVSLGKRLDSDD